MLSIMDEVLVSIVDDVGTVLEDVTSTGLLVEILKFMQ